MKAKDKVVAIIPGREYTRYSDFKLNERLKDLASGLKQVEASAQELLVRGIRGIRGESVILYAKDRGRRGIVYTVRAIDDEERGGYENLVHLLEEEGRRNNTRVDFSAHDSELTEEQSKILAERGLSNNVSELQRGDYLVLLDQLNQARAQYTETPESRGEQ